MENIKFEEKELAYYEKDSYMQAVFNEYNTDILVGIVDRVNSIEGVEVLGTIDLSENGPGFIKLSYNNEEYEVGYYFDEFHFFPMYARGPFKIKEKELENIQNAKHCLVTFMEFKSNPKVSFHLQLKLMNAMMPELVAIVDESAEKLLPRSWVKMTCASNATPSANDIYTVQAISGEDDSVWIHTHGLNRCHTTEVEILNSNRDLYNVHFNLISTYASYLLDNVNEEPRYNLAHLGFFKSEEPIVATCISWCDALNEYENLTLGNINDRDDGHNSKSSVIFLYKNQEDYNNKIVTKVENYNNLWGDNPLLFISNSETEIRKVIAKERFNYLKELSKDKENEILLKIGLVIDENGQREHIYFRLIEFINDSFKAVLLQEPYANINMKPGDEGVYAIDDVSDWVVYTANGTITPANVYLLDKE